MDQFTNVAFGVAAVLLGFFVLVALWLGIKELGRFFRQFSVAKKITLSPEEASEVREAIDAFRMAKKAEKAADANAAKS